MTESNNNNNQAIDQNLSRARVQLLLSQPFFGTLCLRLKLVPALSFPTMATDGRRLVYNPAFVEKLTAAELEGVVAHETMHVALAHHCRRGDRDAQLWNQATDYAVNPILINNGITLPKDALLDAAFANLGAEEIYAHSRQPQTHYKSRNHRSKNRKIRPHRREFRLSPPRLDQEVSERFWMRSARTAKQHRRPS